MATPTRTRMDTFISDSPADGDFMLVGFCSSAADLIGAKSEKDVLAEFGCERIFGPDPRRFVSGEAIEYLRPGDVLVVATMARLAPSIDEIAFFVERLHKSDVAVHVVDGRVELAHSESFVKTMCMLANFFRATPKHRTAKVNPVKQVRGRPAALNEDDRERAAQLLRRTTVVEVARILNVCPATIYRYFPRGTVRPLKSDLALKSAEAKSDVASVR